MGHPHIIIGQLGASQGLAGWQRVKSFADPEENLFQYQPWQIQRGDHWEEHEIENYRRHGQHWLVKLKDCDDCDHAKQLTNAKIAIEREQLAELDEDEFYLTDLEGLTVYNQNHIELGKVDHIFSTGANDILVVKGQGEHLIPLVFDEFVTEINLKKGFMQVQWDDEV